MSEENRSSIAGLSHDIALLTGRCLLGAVMLIAGFNAYQDMSDNIAWYGRLGIPVPQFTAPFAAAFQAMTGLALIVGIKTRLVALLVGAFWALAAIVGHSALLSVNDRNVFLLEMAVIAGCFAFYAAGAGRYSIDGRDRQ